jgi:hypothetical protein
MKAFTDYRRALWLGAFAVLMVGFGLAALLLPSTSDPTRGLGPAVHVPKMQNVPPENARVNLDGERNDERKP